MRTVIDLIALGIILVVVSILPPAAHGEINFAEGMWEMNGELKFEGTMKINGKEFPMKPKALHYSKCITKKDMVPLKEEKNQSCKKVTEKISGNTATWTLKCTGANRTVVESSISAVFSRTSFDAKGRSVLTDKQGEISKATVSMKGRRTGPCK